MALTPSQKLAIEAPSHCVLIANAGSGKTFTLVEQYLHLIEHRTDVSAANIAAITFTENAANELKEKITSGIFKRLASLEKNQASVAAREQLWKALQEIDLSFVSTIHGFCSRLLRLYPIEAGIDPSFVILQGVEQTLLVDECIDSILHDRLKIVYDTPSEDPTNLRRTFTYYGINKLREFIRPLFTRRFRAREALEELHTKGDHRLDEEATRSFEDAIVAIFAQSDVHAALTELPTLILPTASGTEAIAAISRFRAADSIDRIIPAAVELLESILTKSETPQVRVFSQTVGGKKTSNVERAEALIDGPLSEIIRLRKAFAAYIEWNSVKTASFDHLRNVCSLYQEAFARYATEKSAHGMLDHDDLIDLGVTLLQNPPVAEEIAKELKYCFVDEYQDTDERQYEIITRLTDSFKNHIVVTVVGDPKQSIYRFRDANLEVFHRTVDECLASSIDAIKVQLDVCFRMLPAPLTAVNLVTDHLFGSDQEIQQRYFYEPLIGHRDEPGRGSVTFLVSSKAEPDEDDDTQTSPSGAESEEQLVAKSIRRLVSGEPKKQFKDIAILLRERKHLPILELVLRSYDIPYSMSGGLGFYQQQEVIDAMNLVNLLTNPDDDLSVVAVLRSPYIGFDDRTLWNLLHQRNRIDRRISLWRFIGQNPAALSDHLSKRLAFIKELLPLVGRVGVRSLLELAIARSQIELVYYAFTDGAQKISNLRKFVDLSSRGDLSIWQFAEQCTVMQQNDEREQQAVQPTDDAVHIMTVHGSKGLEFPVVFLPYLGEARRKRSSSSTLLLRQKPFVRLAVPQPDGELEHPICALSDLRNAAEEIEEEQRILYVAMTRAENELYLGVSLTAKQEIASGSALEEIAAAFGITAADLLAGLPIPFERKFEIFDGTGTRSEIFHGKVDVVRSLDVEPLKSLGSEKNSTEAVRVDLRSYPPGKGVTRYSPTQLLTYLECPTKYYLRYKLGLPEEYVPDVDYEPAERSEYLQASLYGQILHRTLEHLERIAPSSLFNETAVREAFDRLAAEYHIDGSTAKRYLERLLPETKRFTGTDLSRSILASSKRYAELPLRYALDESLILSGVIDSVFQDADGVWNVVDYKTTVKPDDKDLGRYQFQIQVYSFLIFKLFDVSTVKTHLYFTSSGTIVSSEYSDIDFIAFDARLRDTIIGPIVAETHSKSVAAISKNRDHCKECQYSPDRIARCIVDPEPVERPAQEMLSLI